MVLCGKITYNRKAGRKMKDFKIYLIEDELDHAEKELKKLNEVAKQYDGEFYFEWIQGEIKKIYEEKTYFFYENEVILEEIEKRFEEEMKQGNQIGILLDVLLTEEDINSALASYYPQASVAREIYFRFCDKMPIYIITATPAFGYQSDVIMGKDLSDQYLDFTSFTKYDFRDDSDKMFKFYTDFYQQEDMRLSKNE